MGLLDLGPGELEAGLLAFGEPAYRADQIRSWIFKRFARDYDLMTDLPRSLLDRLAIDLPINPFTLVKAQESARDGTRKLLLKTRDGICIETVIILQGDRITLCISTQAGCSLGCSFCATGAMGLHRNLTQGEILGQVVWGCAESGRRVQNVVLMGMGEPLLNFSNVSGALGFLASEQGFGVGTRRITLSTVGVVPGIRKLTTDPHAPNLAISLHGATQTLRERIVPSARRWPLYEILDAADEYAEKTAKLVTYEYVLISGINASPADADALGRLLRDRRGKVNLIPQNPVPGIDLTPPEPSVVRRFRSRLGRYSLTATLRVERGADIAAGCGQLAGGEEGEKTRKNTKSKTTNARSRSARAVGTSEDSPSCKGKGKSKGKREE